MNTKNQIKENINNNSVNDHTESVSELTPIYGLENGPTIIPIMFNGIQLNMLLDSGAFDNMLDERVFYQLNEIKALPKIQQDNQLFGFEGSEFETQFQTQLDITIGKRNFDTPFIVFKLDAFDAVCEQYDITIHGVLGFNFIVNNQLIIDYPKSMIYINTSNSERTLTGELTEMSPIYGLRNGIAVAKVQYEDIQLQLLIDTGASHNMLDERVFDKISEIRQTNKSQTDNSVHGFGGSESDVNYQSIMNITMGDNQFETTFQLLQIRSLETITPATGIMLHGVLGIEFFVDNNLTLDFSKGMIYSSLKTRK